MLLISILFHLTSSAPYRLLDPFLRHHLGTVFIYLWKSLGENERPLHTIQHGHVSIESKEPTKKGSLLLWLPYDYGDMTTSCDKDIEDYWGITGAGSILFFSPRNAGNILFDCESFTFPTLSGMPVIDWQAWAVTMGTRMEVTQLESRMNAEDYRRLQGLFLVSACMAFWEVC